MSAVIPSYAYTYIKIGFLKQLIMDEKVIRQIKEFDDIKEFTEFIRPYYPELTLQKFKVEELERSLFHNYIKIVGKIIRFSPDNMRFFLRAYLLKYEIFNLKQILFGTIAGTSMEEKSKNINDLVEKLLDNSEFIRNLLDVPSLEEIQFFLRGSRYNEAVREGILYYKNNQEIFVLAAFLDRLYYENFLKIKRFFNKKEKKMISLYIDYKTELYNINILFRGIRNNIDRKLLSQFLVDNYLFFNKEIFHSLLNGESEINFISELSNHFKKIGELKPFFKPFDQDVKHLMWLIEKLYIKYFFKKVQIKNDDIDYLTIYQILRVLILKEAEIRFEILPKIVKLINEKFRVLKTYFK